MNEPHPFPSFLFRFDGSRDNDKFMELRGKRHGSRLYAGTPMKVGPGWIPDFAEVFIDEPAMGVQLTLIELEATDIAARESCRKYLCESSSAICEAFSQYISTVVSQCRGTADPRLIAFQHLKEFLGKAPTLALRTAGALRDSPDFLEDFPLIGQSGRSSVQVPADAATNRPALVFVGKRRLSREEVQGLWRVVQILHALMIGKDHYAGTLEACRKLLKRQIDAALNRESEKGYPEVQKLFAVSPNEGAMIDCDKIITELAELWAANGTGATSDRVQLWINGFHPVARSFRNHTRMQAIFSEARNHITNREQYTDAPAVEQVIPNDAVE